MGSAVASGGQSLWRDAWRRLRRNKAAMAGLVIVVLMSALAIVAPWVVPYQPDYGQPWLQAQPPGYEHPAVLAEIRFDKDEPPVVPKGLPPLVAEIIGEDGVITYTAQEVATTEYRVKLRRGKVDRITQLAGAERVNRLDVEGELAYAQVVDADGNAGPELRNLVVERRKPLPAALATKERVLVLRVRQPRTAGPERIAVTIDGGLVTSIERGGEERDKLRLQGRFVHVVAKDGEEQRLAHLLGTDLAGRDVLSRVVYGGRISLMVGAIATLVSVLIGVVYGAVAGYASRNPVTAWGLFSAVVALTVGVGASILIARAGKEADLGLSRGAAGAILVLNGVAWLVAVSWVFAWIGRAVRWRAIHRTITTVGEFMMRVVDILYALPFMFLVILLMISFGQDIFTLFVALGCVQWLMMARIVRGQVLSLKEKEFVEAARMCGTGHMGIVFRHLIPNTLGVVIVYATLTVPAVILQESFLAFIGLTVEFQDRTLDSWGSLVNQGRQALTSTGGNWWVLVFPSVAMAVTLFSLNFLGDGLRDALDPQLKGKG